MRLNVMENIERISHSEKKTNKNQETKSFLSSDLDKKLAEKLEEHVNSHTKESEDLAVNDPRLKKGTQPYRLHALQRMTKLLKNKDFAKKIGIGESLYNKFASGERPLNLNAAQKIKAKCDVTIDWLIEGDTSGLSVAIKEALERAGCELK